jgi:phasin family protein
MTRSATNVAPQNDLDEGGSSYDIGVCAPHNKRPLPQPGHPIMPDARLNPFDFDVTKIFADFRVRPLDVEAVWAAQRRNIEAMSQANQAAVEGVNALARRQIELARETFEGFSTLLRDLAQPASPEERVAKNTEYVKQMIEKGVNHGREITTIATKASSDAAEILHRRASESLDEIRSYASQQAAR